LLRPVSLAAAVLVVAAAPHLLRHHCHVRDEHRLAAAADRLGRQRSRVTLWRAHALSPPDPVLLWADPGAGGRRLALEPCQRRDRPAHVQLLGLLSHGCGALESRNAPRLALRPSYLRRLPSVSR